MSRLYGPEEGYQIQLKKGTIKKIRKPEKSPRKVVNFYSIIREKISELISDQEPVIESPLNSIIDLDSLTHYEFVAQASKVMIEHNPEGHPPLGVSMPTMKRLIERLDHARNSDQPSYASVVKTRRMEMVNKTVMSVHFSPSLELRLKARQETQYALATIAKAKASRELGKRDTTPW